MTNTKKNILLIEDDKAITLAYKEFLERRGYAVRCAYDGKEGLAIAKQEKPDLILLDIVMPVMDGLTMYKKLKKDASFGDVPVIVLTNSAVLKKDETFKGLEGKEPAYWLTKSDYSLEELLKKIKTVIE